MPSNVDLNLLKARLFEKYFDTIQKRTKLCEYWDAIEGDDNTKRKQFIHYIFAQQNGDWNTHPQKKLIAEFIGASAENLENELTGIPKPSQSKLFERFLEGCIPEIEIKREDPHVTAGIKNYYWFILFVALALPPFMLALPTFMNGVKSAWSSETTPPSASNTPAKGQTTPVNSTDEDMKKLYVLEARFNDTYSTVQAIGLSAGLFGVLITVITLFFALKESERVKDAMNRINEMEDVFKSFDGMREQARAAKEDARFAVKDARYAASLVRDALADAKAAQNAAKEALDNANMLSDAASKGGQGSHSNKLKDLIAQIKIHFGEGNADLNSALTDLNKANDPSNIDISKIMSALGSNDLSKLIQAIKEELT